MRSHKGVAYIRILSKLVPLEVGLQVAHGVYPEVAKSALSQGKISGRGAMPCPTWGSMKHKSG